PERHPEGERAQPAPAPSDRRRRRHPHPVRRRRGGGRAVPAPGPVASLDRAIDGVTRARASKQRRRGASAGELLVSLAESMLVGGDAFNDLEDLRADAAGAELRAVAEVPAASTAAQLARRLRPSHLRAAEAALAGAGDRLDTELGRDPAAPVTLDFDSTLVEGYGRNKPGRSGA